VHHAKNQIIEAAMERDFRTIENLVSEIQDLTAEIAKYAEDYQRQRDELQAAGYTTNDARYYATGAQPEYFGGGLVAIKPAK
jgi:phage host-nuclease inhibitor protein Gam